MRAYPVVLRRIARPLPVGVPASRSAVLTRWRLDVSKALYTKQWLARPLRTLKMLCRAVVLALAAAGQAARGAAAYVTMEPCGRRSSGGPSCSERLIAAGVARVVIACDNPDPLSAGTGVRRMAAAAIPLTLGLLAEEAQAALYSEPL